MFKGSITALITPFKNGEVDYAAFETLVEWQIESGTDALVPCGTTGESPTLSHDEHHIVVERCIAISKDRVPVIAGTGSNSTREAISLTLHAQKAGANAALVVTPYYNKPSQDGLYQHYKTLHDATNIPIIIYNIPGRSVIDMSVDTMCKLAELPRIVGVKDATGDLGRPLMMKNRLGDSFCQLSGNDDTATGFLAQGGHGCISVTSNVAPALCAQMQDAWAAGNIADMIKARDLLAPIHKALFCETSPGPIKYAVSRLGIGSDEVRLPLVPASISARKMVDDAMQFAGLLDKSGASKRVA